METLLVMKLLVIKSRFILDGFPRNVSQAKILDDLLVEQKVESRALSTYQADHWTSNPIFKVADELDFSKQTKAI